MIRSILCTPLTARKPAVVRLISSRAMASAVFAELGKEDSFTSSTILVSPAWLHAHGKDVTVLDASWWLPAAGRNAKTEFDVKRIPGAAFFDIDAISDKSSSLPHMLPTEEQFAGAAAQLGIAKSKPCVVYDTAGLFSAGRVWFTLKAFGHPQVALLHGGLPRWEKEGFPVEAGAAGAGAGAAAPKEEWSLNKALVWDMQQILKVVEKKQTAGGAVAAAADAGKEAELIVDARPAPRFEGTAPEPRPGLPSGHMPGARNVPFASLLNPDSCNQFLPPAELQEALRKAGVHVEREGRIVTSCGSGVSAAVVLMALHLLGRPLEKLSLYDGSWTDYGSVSSNPKVMGKAEAE